MHSEVSFNVAMENKAGTITKKCLFNIPPVNVFHRAFHQVAITKQVLHYYEV